MAVQVDSTTKKVLVDGTTKKVLCCAPCVGIFSHISGSISLTAHEDCYAFDEPPDPTDAHIDADYEGTFDEDWDGTGGVTTSGSGNVHQVSDTTASTDDIPLSNRTVELRNYCNYDPLGDPGDNGWYVHILISIGSYLCGEISFGTIGAFDPDYVKYSSDVSSPGTGSFSIDLTQSGGAGLGTGSCSCSFTIT